VKVAVKQGASILVLAAGLVTRAASAAPARYEIEHDHGAFVDESSTISFVTVKSCGESTRDYLAKNLVPIRAVVTDTKEAVVAIEVGDNRHLISASRTVDGREKEGSGKLYGFWDWSEAMTIAAVIDFPRGEVTIALMRHGTTMSDRFEKACVERWRATLRRTP
jgi:hypothetical protein